MFDVLLIYGAAPAIVKEPARAKIAHRMITKWMRFFFVLMRLVNNG
jgi:hypothetical protein